VRLALIAVAFAVTLIAGAAVAYPHKALHLARLAFDRVPCPPQTDRTMVAVAFGQSNAGNQAQYRHRARANVLNFFDGSCFRAKDPLLGAEGMRGSIWTLMGDSLSERFDYVVVAPVAVGSTRIAHWNGALAERLEERLAALKAGGYRVTHFLWQQGEADAGVTPASEYAAALSALIARSRRDFPAAGFWVAQASRCGTLADPGIRRAQSEVVAPGLGIYPGPNTDTIPREQRFDGCHFARSGQERAARLWAEAISGR
jgi:Carbohydrate esterase, sialic acid-specific acetylesterase